MSNIIDILPLSLLILLFYGAKLIKPLPSLNREYLSLNTGKYYRGIFAIVVVFHHLTQQTTTGFIFREFQTVGFLAVSIFFFLSGYGLQKSYIAKSEHYNKGFLLKRIPTVLIPYLVFIVLYWLMYLIGGDFYSLKYIIVGIINGKPFVDNAWYILNILVFYFAYWILMKLCKKHHFLMILGGLIWYFLYFYYCIKQGYGEWWYNSSQLLIVGMFWATYEHIIIEILNKTYIIIAPIIWFSFILLYRKPESIIEMIPSSYNMIIVTEITAILFALSVILFSLKIQIGNKILGFLGEISFEIYMAQGIFMQTLRSKFFYIENEFFWCIAVLTGTIIFSYFLHIILQLILKRYMLLLRRFGL